MKKISFTIVFCISFTILFAQPSFVKDSLENYITKGLKDWQIPGLAVAIVKDGKVVVMKGFGVSDLATKKPVDETTLFMIASNSKLFTGTALAQLEYNKKLSLNDKIVKHIPDFKLYNKNVQELVTIKDMLSHKLGTKTFLGDFTFWDSKLTRKEIINKMQFMEPKSQYRQDFGYCNSCYLTAGEIIPIVTKMPWEVYIHDSIIAPLQMNNTSVLGRNMEKMPNAARPYTSAFSTSLQALPYDNVDNLAPAGSIVSCVKDVSKWLLMQLDSGRYNGNRILPWSVIRRTRDINNAMSSRKNGSTHFTGYGLGVFINDYAGKQVFWHTGGAFGFVTNTCFVPEENLGITILTNQDNQEFFELLRLQILDAYLGVPYANKSEEGLPDFTKSQQEQQGIIAANTAKVKGSKPPIPLANFVGEYANTLYGSISITEQGKDLKIKFNGHENLTALLQYMEGGNWLMTYSNRAFGIFETPFTIKDNKVISVSIKAADFVEYDAYIFTKQ